MSNKEIANAFDELANLLELHEENEFKIRSYRNAYLTLRKLDRPLADLSDAEIQGIKGIGAAISGKIRELLAGGKMKALDEARAQTPAGVADMLQVNGFGPKKVRAVWREMGIETIGELLYACNENRLVEYKGFGLKTQDDLKRKLEYYLRSKDKLHLDAAEAEADFVGAWLTGKLPGAFVSPVGELRRRCPVVSRLLSRIAAMAGASSRTTSGQATQRKARAMSPGTRSRTRPRILSTGTVMLAKKTSAAIGHMSAWMSSMTPESIVSGCPLPKLVTVITGRTFAGM